MRSGGTIYRTPSSYTSRRRVLGMTRVRTRRIIPQSRKSYDHNLTACGISCIVFSCSRSLIWLFFSWVWYLASRSAAISLRSTRYKSRLWLRPAGNRCCATSRGPAVVWQKRCRFRPLQKRPAGLLPPCIR
jgi:hypothetical protein